ncbi:hypothetical protein COOONC_07464 [Cooperia oncophora]
MANCAKVAIAGKRLRPLEPRQQLTKQPNAHVARLSRDSTSFSALHAVEMLRTTPLVVIRRFSSNSDKNNLKKIVVCRNGSVAAWHPETPFPYEHSRPVVLEEAKKEESPLSRAVNRTSRWKDGPVVAQLQRYFLHD